MRNKFDIITIGGAVRDITFYTGEGDIIDNPRKDPTCLKLLGFEYGAKIKIDEANFSFGGGAQNAAVCFSRLGFNVLALISIGNDDYGNSIIKNLKKNKVNTQFVQIQKDAGTGFSFILTDRKTSEHVVFSYRGADSKLSVKSEDLKKISPKWIYMTSLSGEWKKNVLNKVFRHKKESNVKISWNPGKSQLNAGYHTLKEFFDNTDVLILNKDEAIELKAKVGANKNMVYKKIKVEELLHSIYKMNKGAFHTSFRIILITDGRNGAYAYDGKNIYHSKIKDVKRVDTTGVGDAFGASFIAGLEMYKGNIEKALKLGILNTSSVIGKIGAENGLLYKKDILL